MVVVMEEVMVVVTVEDMVVTMAKDQLNLDMDMVGVLGHMVAIVVDVEVTVEDLFHMVGMEEAMVEDMEGGMGDMVEVIMERERLDMVAMEVAMEVEMVVVMDLAMEAMVEAIL